MTCPATRREKDRPTYAIADRFVDQFAQLAAYRNPQRPAGFSDGLVIGQFDHAGLAVIVGDRRTDQFVGTFTRLSEPRLSHIERWITQLVVDRKRPFVETGCDWPTHFNSTLATVPKVSPVSCLSESRYPHIHLRPARKQDPSMKWIVLIGGTVLTSWCINAAIATLLKIPLDAESKIDSGRPFEHLPRSLLIKFTMLGSIALAYCVVAFVLSLFDCLPDGMNGVKLWL